MRVSPERSSVRRAMARVESVERVRDRCSHAGGGSAQARHLFRAVGAALACAVLVAGCSSSEGSAKASTTAATSGASGSSGGSGQTGTPATCSLDASKQVGAPVRIAAPAAPGPVSLLRSETSLEAGFGAAPDVKTLDSTAGLIGLADGSVDFAVVDSYTFGRFLTAVSGPPPVAVWILNILNTDGALISTTVDAPNALVDQKVAAPKAGLEGFSLASSLTKAGVNVSSVDWADIPADQALTQTLAGEVAATFAIGPANEAGAAAGAKLLETSGALAKKGAPVFDLLVASPAFLSAHPDATDFLLCSVDAAVSAIVADPVASGAKMAAVVGVDAAVVTSRLLGYQYLPAASQVLPEYLDGGLVANFSWAGTIGNALELNEKPPADDILKTAMSVEPARRVVNES